jgi:hypothetical protein
MFGEDNIIAVFMEEVKGQARKMVCQICTQNVAGGKLGNIPKGGQLQLLA